MTDELDGLVAFITGGAAGLGLAHARLLAERGAEVAISDLTEKATARARSELKRAGHDILAVKADNRRPKEITAAIAAAEKHFGRIDILVNNAGISGKHRKIEEISEAIYDRLFDTHVKGAFFATAAVAPGMKRRRFGRIVNTGSHMAMAGAPAMSHYVAAKGALHAMTRAWARELAPWQITVNTIAPGLVQTPMTDDDLTPEQFDQLVATCGLGRTPSAEEIAYAVAWLVGPEAVMVTGQAISPNGGRTYVGL